MAIQQVSDAGGQGKGITIYVQHSPYQLFNQSTINPIFPP
jgi:hypothetical protein